MRVWVVSREYAGIAEAGGVKNVACSLSETLVQLGHAVTLFIPLYGCTDLSHVKDYSCIWHRPVNMHAWGMLQHVGFSHGYMNGVEIVFVSAPPFYKKKAVYTYTKSEERQDPRHKKGTGHEDSPLLNTLFQKAVIEYAGTCEEHEAPQILHCQDATTALIPVLLAYRSHMKTEIASFFSRTACLVTIHNAGPGYHHSYESLEAASRCTGLPVQWLEGGLNGTSVEPFLLAADHAVLTTVSPQYAEEIMAGTTETAGLSEHFRAKGISIEGITNGIDFEKYNPSDTAASLLPFAFDPENLDLEGKYHCRRHFLQLYAAKNISSIASSQKGEAAIEKHGFLAEVEGEGPPIYISYHGRIVRQKGIDILSRAADVLLAKELPLRFIIFGQGEAVLENELASLAERYPGKVVYLCGYDRSLSRLCTASADFAVFPSTFEPCGLEDFIAQLFGTLPVAHATGGLKKIIDNETGFLYSPCTSERLCEVLESLAKTKKTSPEMFESMVKHAARHVRTTYSWRSVVQNQYLALYQKISKK